MIKTWKTALKVCERHCLMFFFFQMLGFGSSNAFGILFHNFFEEQGGGSGLPLVIGVYNGALSIAGIWYITFESYIIIIKVFIRWPFCVRNVWTLHGIRYSKPFPN